MTTILFASITIVVILIATSPLYIRTKKDREFEERMQRYKEEREIREKELDTMNYLLKQRAENGFYATGIFNIGAGFYETKDAKGNVHRIYVDMREV